MPKKYDASVQGSGGADGAGPSGRLRIGDRGQRRGRGPARCGTRDAAAVVSQAEVDAGSRPGVTSESAEEIKRLKAENKRLREANEILRKASIFFAGELDPRNR